MSKKDPVILITNDDGIQSPGLKTLVWDGKDSMGNKVGAGIYIYQLKSDNYIESKKMIFVK